MSNAELRVHGLAVSFSTLDEPPMVIVEARIQASSDAQGHHEFRAKRIVDLARPPKSIGAAKIDPFVMEAITSLLEVNAAMQMQAEGRIDYDRIDRALMPVLGPSTPRSVGSVDNVPA